MLLMRTLMNQMYSRVHKSSDSFFSKILEKPSIVQKKYDTSYKRAAFFAEMKQKKIKMADSKKLKFSKSPILKIFS